MYNRSTAEINLIKALEIYQKQWIDLVEEKADNTMEFSEKFESRMQKLIDHHKKPYRFVNTTFKKSIARILIILISFSTVVFSVKALREPVISFIVEVYEKYSTLIFSEKDDQSTNDNPTSQVLEPTYLPQGFTLSTKTDMESAYKREYINTVGSMILYEQTEVENGVMNVDTEGIDYEGIMPPTKPARCFRSHWCWRIVRLPDRSGIEGLKRALPFRLYANINEDEIIVKDNILIYRTLDCRVQNARKEKGMEVHPCKSVGIIEYTYFAKVIDDRFECEAISCYPEITDATFNCAWKFTLLE